MPLWIWIQSVLFVVNIAMAWYFFSIFSRPYSQQDPKEYTFGSRLTEVLCNNPVVALYIIVAVFVLVWQFIGMSWISSNHTMPVPDDCTGYNRRQVHYVICGPTTHLLLLRHCQACGGLFDVLIYAVAL
jgi:hypothetical protein